MHLRVLPQAPNKNYPNTYEINVTSSNLEAQTFLNLN